MKQTPSDLGTPELARRHQVRVELAGQNNVRPRIRVLDQRILDRLRVRGNITEDDYLAGDRLFCLAYKAGITASIISNIHAAVRVRSAVSNEYRQTEARDRVRKALGWVTERKGAKASSSLVGVVLNDQPVGEWARAARLHRSKGMGVLKSALGALHSYWVSEANAGRYFGAGSLPAMARPRILLPPQPADKPGSPPGKTLG